MTVDDLIVDFRDEADDSKLPYLWPDDALIRYANDAQLEAAVRARFFLDSTVTVKVKANTGIAVLPPRVIQVRGARVIGNDLRLCPTYRRDMDCWPGWEDEHGDACRFIRDYTAGRLRLHPIPLVDIVVRLTALLGPAEPLTAGGELEIPVQFQRSLVFWMLHRAFSKRDSGGDARDDKLARYYEEKFTEAFGPRRAAIDEVFEQQQEDVYGDQGGFV